MRLIAHATDFSPEGLPAFAHALRLAVAFRSGLYLLHVHDPDRREDWSGFPHVREQLAAWGLLSAGASVDDIAAELGVTVRKIEIRHREAIGGIVRFLAGHPPDLLVLATHGLTGLSRWLSGSVSGAIATEARVPTLFLGPSARPFVDAGTGSLSLAEVVVPVAREPSPRRALRVLEGMLAPLAPSLRLVHVGETAPWLLDERGDPRQVELRHGPVVETVLDLARGADLVAMPTAGHHGFLDALRGSTTERVVAEAPCPVLALPA
ncbi:MAG: universal stress protein [Hyphomicrobiaceae bacterium]